MQVFWTEVDPTKLKKAKMHLTQKPLMLILNSKEAAHSSEYFLLSIILGEAYLLCYSCTFKSMLFESVRVDRIHPSPFVGFYF